MVDEVLDFYVKATGKDGAEKRQEFVDMRPGELRRSLEALAITRKKNNASWKRRRKPGSFSGGSQATNRPRREISRRSSSEK